MALAAAVVKSIHARLGTASAAAFATRDVLHKIACESGLPERETYAQLVLWNAQRGPSALPRFLTTVSSYASTLAVVFAGMPGLVMLAGAGAIECYKVELAVVFGCMLSAQFPRALTACLELAFVFGGMLYCWTLDKRNDRKWWILQFAVVFGGLLLSMLFLR